MRIGIIGAGNMGATLAGLLDGLDAGPLAESWRQPPGTPIYATDLPPAAARQALADATPEQAASWRSHDLAPM